MRRGAAGGAVAWAIVTLAAVPAAAAAGVPLWLAVIAAGEVVAAFQLAGNAAVLMWAAAMSLSVCLVALKFLMPLRAAQYSQEGLCPPMAIFIAWAFAIIASIALTLYVGARIFPQTAQLNPSLVPAVFVLWLSIEIVGTLGMSVASLRPKYWPPPPCPSDPQILPTTHTKRVSALSAEDLLVRLRSMLMTPDEQLPKGIEPEGDGRTLITSERKLARALDEPRTRVVRLLKQLEREGKLMRSVTHRDTYIHIPDPLAKRIYEGCDGSSEARSPSRFQPALLGRGLNRD